MNSEIQVVLTGNAADLQDTLDSTTGSLDALGATADKTAAQVAGSSGATDEAAASTAELGDAASVTSGRLVEAGEAADASAADIDVASDAAKGGAFSFGALGDTIKTTILPLLGLFVAYEGIKDTIKDTADATDMYDNSEAQINQTLKNTNDAIGLSISQINELADATAKNTVISSNQNLAVEQTLLGYSAINKDALPQSISLVDDLATRMAKGATPSTQQLNTASKALGKALEDPATGMTAFTRATVTFTPAQVAAVKAMEAAGNTAGAQALEMKDLTDIVGGDASAATDTFSGKVTELKNSLEPLEIAAGTDLHNALTTLGQDFVDSLPEIEKTADAIGSFLYPSIVALWNAIKDLMPVLEQIWKEYLAPLVPIVGGTLVIAFDLFINALRIFIEVITDVTKFILQHRVALMAVAGALATLAAMWLVTAIPAAIAWAAAGVAAAAAWLAAAAPFIAIIAIGAAIAAVAYEIVDHWNDVKQWFDDAVNWMKEHWETILSIIFPFMAIPLQIIQHWDAVKQWFDDLKNDVVGVFKDVGSWLYNAGHDLIQGFINGIEDMAGQVFDKVKDLGDKAVSALKGVLKIFSPSQVFADIGQNVGLGLIQGIVGTQDDVSQASGALATSAITGATSVPTQSLTTSTAANNGSGGGAGIVINVAGNLMELSGQDATDMMSIISRNTELSSLGITTLTPGATS